jgi:predicted glycosyltransferase
MGNCIFRPHSSEGFLDDLAGAYGIVASAGASLIGECMHLRKPMLLLPVAGQYEQLVNARYAQKLGLGMSTRRLDADALGRFLHFLGAPVPTHPDILWPDNEGFFRVLQGVLNRLAGGIDIMSALPLEVPVSSA